MLAEWITWDRVDDMTLDDVDLMNLLLDARERARAEAKRGPVEMVP